MTQDNHPFSITAPNGNEVWTSVAPFGPEYPKKGISMSDIGLRDYGPTPQEQKSKQRAQTISTIKSGVKSALSSLFGSSGPYAVLGQALASVGSSLLQNKFQKDAEKRANAEWQRRFDLENAYNHPAAQADRFRQAGINPLSGLGLSTPAGSPAVPVSSAPDVSYDLAGTHANLASARASDAQGQLSVAQALTETFKQDLLKAEKENLISKTKGQDLANAFDSLIFDHKVQDFKNKVRLVANDLSRSDMELPLYQYTIALDILLKNQKLQIGEYEMAQMYANILNINADTKVKEQYKKNLQLEFDKFDWEKKKFFLDKFFELQMQYNNFGHEKEMLEMSQSWNAVQNDLDRAQKAAERGTSIFNTILNNAPDLLFVVGAVMTATGVGGGVGIPLMLGGASGMLLTD